MLSLSRAGLVAMLVSYCAVSGLAKGPKYTDPKKADADFAIQGEYTGHFQLKDSKEKFGVQVIAMGDGQFTAVGFHGGLPGDGWNGEEPVKIGGTPLPRIENGVLTLKDEHGEGVLKDGKLVCKTADGKEMGTLVKVHRKSPTLGKKPPQGALVLFDGRNTDQWKNGRLDKNLLMEGVTSLPKFGSHKIHIEFRLPYQPQDRGQGRGNSGIYVQGRYECQMLDSFGLQGKHNECGGLYSVKDPDLNMCFPPLSWQTYDIDYTAAKFDKDGKRTANPRVTIRHNGVVIHNDVELPGERSTTAAPSKPGDTPGPVYLQNHGCPVRYRNIWVVKKDT